MCDNAKHFRNSSAQKENFLLFWMILLRRGEKESHMMYVDEIIYSNFAFQHDMDCFTIFIFFYLVAAHETRQFECSNS